MGTSCCLLGLFLGLALYISQYSETTLVGKTVSADRRPTYAVLVIALGISLLSNVLGLAVRFWLMPWSDASYSYLGDDRPRALPIGVRSVNLIFHDDPEHYSLNGINAAAEWDNIIPEGSGIVFLGDSSTPFQVSMWHQIYCLNHIRTAFIEGDNDAGFTEHCFHYLRQGILCAADTTLEPVDKSMLPETRAWRPSSSNVTHTCRDWRQVYEWMNNSQNLGADS